VATAALAGALASPAGASNHPNTIDKDAWRAPAFQLVPDRDHGRERHRGANYHHGGYRGGHEGYYGAPPIVYARQGYYQQPGISLNFGTPIF
jgi:hypothetical protein